MGTKELSLEFSVGARGLNLKFLGEISKELGIPWDEKETREAFEGLEVEGLVCRATDEITGKELWFPSSALDYQDKKAS